MQTTKGNVVDQEIVKLGLGLKMPSRTQRGVKLTSDQYNEMILRINDHGGTTMLEEMEEQIETSIYQEAPIGGEGGKLEQLKSILTRRKTDVLDEMFEDEDFGLGEKKQALKDYMKQYGKQLKQ